MKTLLIPVVLTAFAISACQPILSGATPATLPEAMQGAWGLTENDCNPDFDPRKGLMVVTDDALSFYESRASLTEVRSGNDNRVEASFAFSGEGQSWDVEMTLETQDAGMVLVRKDLSGTDLTEPLRYMNCNAV